MLIRPMSPDDAGGVAQVNRDMHYQSTAEQVSERFVSIMSQPGNAIFVAEHEAMVIGWAHVRLVELLHQAPHPRLVGLAVRKDARGNKVARQLVAACKQWAQAQGHPDVSLP